MKKRKLPSLKLPRLSLKTFLQYAVLAISFVCLNFAMPKKEPAAVALFYAAIIGGFQPIVTGGLYVAASATALSLYASLSAAVQAVLLCVLKIIYDKKKKRMGLERLFYLAACQLPFIFLFPLEGYALFPFSAIWQKTLIAAFFLLLSVLFEMGLNVLLFSAFRSRLSAAQLGELALLWLTIGTGIGSMHVIALYTVSLFALAIGVLLLKNAAAVPFSIVLSLPLCLLSSSLIPAAEYAIIACVALLICPYGKTATVLSFILGFMGTQAIEGLYSASAGYLIAMLLAVILPLVVTLFLPERLFSRARNTLLFYREKTLPRIAINRNRRAVGERLYEVSSLFREIEGAFAQTEEKVDYSRQLAQKLKETFCKNCSNKRRCENRGTFESMEKLVAVGYAKGQVSLVDLSADLSSGCGNAAGLLFACNKLLADYRNRLRESEHARESKKLLAEQAHGVSEILKDIALEQSEEFSFSEGETALSRALSLNGILSSEIFVYGEGTYLTVSMTLPANCNAKKICTVASEALNIPLSLAEKIPLTKDRACFILKRKPEYDAIFGVASRTKEGEEACGDTYSVMKIDERRFLVALSDGMGSGENARNVSDKTLTLLESFYKAKMPSETVLNTVNKLISYSSDEMFSCLDLAAVDLDTGEADIVKIGSPVGFILCKEELRVLEGNSLPIGMLDSVHPSTMRAKIGDNEFMLFMSDGVTSAFGSSTELYAYLSALRPLNPQSLAEEILSKALSCYGGRAEDDMTVLAVKLFKSA